MIAAGVRRANLAQARTVTVALLVAGYSGYYLCRSNLSVTMPLIVSEMARRGVDGNTARITMGSVASLGVLAYAIGKFPSGALADYWGGRPNFLLGMTGSIVFTLLFAASGAVPLFTLAWMGNRLVQSLGWAGAVKITSKWIPFRHYGSVMAVISLSYLFGDAVCRQFMALLIAKGIGWRSVFGIAAAVLAGLLFVCLVLLRESPSRIGEAEPPANPAALFRESGLQTASWLGLFRPFLRSAAFWIACALSLGTTILRETFGLWTPSYFTQATSMTAAAAAGNSALFPCLVASP